MTAEAAPRRPSVRERLDAATTLPRIFDIVKDVVERGLRKSRAGIMLGLTELGATPRGFLGGYFVVGSNAIVLNKTVLRHVEEVSTGGDSRTYNAYVFHVLLHEYLHTLGYFSEGEVRPLAHKLSVDALGADHPATLIAAAMTPGAAPEGEVPEYFRRLVYPEVGWMPGRPMPMEIVKGFDLDASPYIL